MIALLVHPIMILMPTGLFSATDWGTKAVNNPGPHGFSEIMYQFSSASANNGSAFDGLGVTYGSEQQSQSRLRWLFRGTSQPRWSFSSAGSCRSLPRSPWRRVSEQRSPLHSAWGLCVTTLRPSVLLLCGTILIIGALLFLPVAALGPLAEHFGPIPFGG